MITTRIQLPSYLQQLIAEQSSQQPLEIATAFAPSNIALIKYWGKRNAELNLPMNSSLSISLGQLGTQTQLSLLNDVNQDEVWHNDKLVNPQSNFATRISDFLNLIRSACQKELYFKVVTHNNIPTAAGLASSASGFAALSLALDQLLQLKLPKTTLSALARLGSGSASRSLYHGFVIWHKGEDEQGSDSIAEAIKSDWQDLRVGVLTVDHAKKSVDSRSGMNNTVKTSKLYQSWPQQAAEDLTRMQFALNNKDFTSLGQIAEHNALSMHATMIASWPPLLYWQPQSVELMHRVWQARQQGIEVYFTMDAGPNLKLLFQQQDQTKITELFPNVQVVNPWDHDRFC